MARFDRVLSKSGGLPEYRERVFAFLILIFAVGMIQEKGTVIRSTIAQKNIAVRWLVYFIGIATILLFGMYGIGYDAGSFIYGNF